MFEQGKKMLFLVLLLVSFSIPSSDARILSDFQTKRCKEQYANTQFITMSGFVVTSYNITGFVSKDNCTGMCERTHRELRNFIWRDEESPINDGNPCGLNKVCLSGDCVNDEDTDICKPVMKDDVLKHMNSDMYCHVACTGEKGVKYVPAPDGTQCIYYFYPFTMGECSNKKCVLSRTKT